MSKLKPKYNSVDNIDPTQWFTYFKSLFTLKPDLEDRLENYFIVDSDNDANILNSPLTESEVAKAISKLKNGKSAGIDGIPGEMFKHCSDILTPIITKIFNAIFTRSVIPDTWKKASLYLFTKRAL